MAYYPVLLDLAGKRVLVVGGGGVAERKVETFLGFGARVDLVSHELSPRLGELEERGTILRRGRDFNAEHLDGVFLVVAATDDTEENRRISREARSRGILVNAVDQPADCTFIVPAVVNRGDLVIAVSTSGKSPALAGRIRADLEKHFGPEYGVFLELMGRVRQRVLERGRTQGENREVFMRILDSPLLEAVGNRDWEAAAAVLSEILETRWSASEVREAVHGAAAD